MLSIERQCFIQLYFLILGCGLKKFYNFLGFSRRNQTTIFAFRPTVTWILRVWVWIWVLIEKVRFQWNSGCCWYSYNHFRFLVPCPSNPVSSRRRKQGTLLLCLENMQCKIHSCSQEGSKVQCWAGAVIYLTKTGRLTYWRISSLSSVANSLCRTTNLQAETVQQENSLLISLNL